MASAQCCWACRIRPVTTPTTPITDPTERSMPPVRITAVMPSAMMPMKAKLRVVLNRLSVEANASGCTQLIPRQITSSATVTQKGWLAMTPWRKLRSRRPVTSSIATPVCWAGRVDMPGLRGSGVADGAGDEAGDLLRRGVGDHLVGHLGAAAHHHHPVADREHVGHAVADQHDGDTLVLEPLDQPQHLRDLTDADSGSGLVHQHELGVGEPRPGDRHCLPLAARHLLDEVTRPRLGLELAEQLGRARVHGGEVDDLEGAERSLALAAEEDVLGRREVIAQGQVLVDDLDALSPRVDRLVEMDRAVVDPDLALGRREVAGDDLDQGRLAGAVVAHEADRLARLDLEAHALGRLDRADMLRASHELEQGLPTP